MQNNVATNGANDNAAKQTGRSPCLWPAAFSTAWHCAHFVLKIFSPALSLPLGASAKVAMAKKKGCRERRRQAKPQGFAAVSSKTRALKKEMENAANGAKAAACGVCKSRRRWLGTPGEAAAPRACRERPGGVWRPGGPGTTRSDPGKSTFY